MDEPQRRNAEQQEYSSGAQPPGATRPGGPRAAAGAAPAAARSGLKIPDLKYPGFHLLNAPICRILPSTEFSVGQYELVSGDSGT
jgi:hypothetical protein